MGDGRVWLLADYIPSIAPCWDSLHDGNYLRGRYALEDVQLAASHLILENFDLTPEAVATLIVGADADALVRAVEDAMFGPERAHVTWSEWALGSLFANGIDPASVPPDRLRGVLVILVATGRTISPGKYISAAVAGSRFASIRSRISPEPTTPEDGAPTDVTIPVDPPALPPETTP